MCVCVYTLCSNIKNSLQCSFRHKWQREIEASSKCFFYKYYKTDFREEKYISTLPDIYIYPLIRFRCSNHKLPVETDRRYAIPREERLCNKCNMLVVGDEFHFMMECPHYEDLRNRYLSKRFFSTKSVNKFLSDDVV